MQDLLFRFMYQPKCRFSCIFVSSRAKVAFRCLSHKWVSFIVCISVFCVSGDGNCQDDDRQFLLDRHVCGATKEQIFPDSCEFQRQLLCMNLQPVECPVYFFFQPRKTFITSGTVPMDHLLFAPISWAQITRFNKWGRTSYFLLRANQLQNTGKIACRWSASKGRFILIMSDKWSLILRSVP